MSVGDLGNLTSFSKMHTTYSHQGGGPIVIKQELASEAGSAISRTSVFSDYLPCGLTRFHFSLCFGIIGFIIFWTGLLLRIYLPKT